ncbi:HCL355Cp [Eremothecium sinecaudum]|uniref:N-(5'-phosphoribosyl)anthranilate isomerase n=1 Tax=Eremothecium sinecaudum TaxID=45286 RepID=A0A109UYD4_9SACH|nr:HCL355Cp [Eremothecium sinecaudum]AMD19796.1 HCL355Cp [Eremothecium sinecaudum]
MEENIIKICGLQTVEAAEAAILASATHLGMICVPNRRRSVQPDVAKAISKLVHDMDTSKKTKVVGVFQNQTIEYVENSINEYRFDAIQLHGSEDWKAFRAHFPKEVTIIKRFAFPQDCEEMLEFQKTAENCYVLLDSEVGGTGELLDWNAISEWSSMHPGFKYVIAGGLTPDNVSEAMRLPGAIGVDVSGGVEVQGQKDILKIRKFIENAYSSIQKT